MPNSSTSQVTLAAVLEEVGQTDLQIERTWRLNERHYGALTGLNKAETAAKHGEEQVGNIRKTDGCRRYWRRNTIF